MERKKAQAIAAASNSNSKLEPSLESSQSTDSNISKL